MKYERIEERGISTLFQDSCFSHSGSNFDWNDLRPPTCRLRPSDPISHVSGTIARLDEASVYAMVFHSPRRGIYRVDAASLEGFLEQFWVGSADIFVISLSFRWCIAITHDFDVITQGALVSVGKS